MAAMMYKEVVIVANQGGRAGADRLVTVGAVIEGQKLPFRGQPYVELVELPRPYQTAV